MGPSFYAANLLLFLEQIMKEATKTHQHVSDINNSNPPKQFTTSRGEITCRKRRTETDNATKTARQTRREPQSSDDLQTQHNTFC